MDRRSFLTTLAALPGLGWLKPEPPLPEPTSVTFAHTVTGGNCYVLTWSENGQVTRTQYSQDGIVWHDLNFDAKPENG